MESRPDLENWQYKVKYLKSVRLFEGTITLSFPCCIGKAKDMTKVMGEQ